MERPWVGHEVQMKGGRTKERSGGRMEVACCASEMKGAVVVLEALLMV
jgi:hypothetical protein